MFYYTQSLKLLDSILCYDENVSVAVEVLGCV